MVPKQDGKHSRIIRITITNYMHRNNMASPIGELFDHLCDSCSLTLCTIMFATAVRMGPVLTFIALISTFIPFYGSHWDDYNTGMTCSECGNKSVLTALSFRSIRDGALWWSYRLASGLNFGIICNWLFWIQHVAVPNPHQ